jgi:hypothetical protein
MATIIIKGVTVNAGNTSSSSAVSIGTVTARAATSFGVNLLTNNNTTVLPAGAIVGFYQTLPGSGEVPYLVEEAPIDPFARNFASSVPLSAQTIDYGTLSSGSVTPTTATPTEGASTYRVSATAPLFTDGALTTTVTSSTGPVTPAEPTVESGAVGTSVSFSIKETTSGKYNAGWLIISHDGAIVSTADLGPVLSTSGGTVTVTGIPGGTSSAKYASGLYYVSVRTWNTTHPATPLNREIYPAALDLRSGATSTFSLSID